MEEKKTREPQYQPLVSQAHEKGRASLGMMTSQVWRDDPRRLVFVLSRYKFAAKMLSGRKHALEVGCGDAFGSRIVRQEVERLTVVDFDPVFIEDAKSRIEAPWTIEARAHDILEGPVPGGFDAAYSLDVIEHIPGEREDRYMENIAKSVTCDGIVIIGTPSVQSQAYASEYSKAGHVNLKDHERLKTLAQRHFASVFIFSMNDEVVHTGFYPMAHYLFALCAGKRE